ncbi:hypothetical protein [Flavobacterium sp. XGLA_31]|uniref:hypothetical protein n=1 Tax=Flavobacterium sp. XGLA_31 TaxID=3447666 RepID=UPI003F2F6123
MKKTALSLLFLFFCTLVFSQNVVTISYGETINLSNVNDKMQFYINGSQGKVHLKGEQINRYKFEKPGNYQIKIVERSSKKAASCESHVFPEEITVNVSPVKMIFDSKNIAFSEPIRKNVSTEHIIMTIPVIISTYNHKPVKWRNTSIDVAGLGSTIVARPLDETSEWVEGTHIVKYALSGLVNLNSYLMFDFKDINNQIQSISLTTPVTN